MTTTTKKVFLTPQILAGLLGLCLVLLLVAYMYFLSASVVQVVLRKELQEKSRSLETDIAMLESTYLERQHTVSERIASVSNLSETSEKIFVTRAKATTVSANR